MIKQPAVSRSRFRPRTATSSWGADLVVVACPTCRAPVTRPADDRLRTVLEWLGVPVLVSPAQTAHPERRTHPDAAPFTIDDLIGFHELLVRPDRFAELLAHETA